MNSNYCYISVYIDNAFSYHCLTEIIIHLMHMLHSVVWVTIDCISRFMTPIAQMSYFFTERGSFSASFTGLATRQRSKKFVPSVFLRSALLFSVASRWTHSLVVLLSGSLSAAPPSCFPSTRLGKDSEVAVEVCREVRK